MFSHFAAVHWASPWLFLFVPVVLLAAIIRWRRVPPALKTSQHQDLPGAHTSSALVRLPWLLEALGMLCLLVAMARPQQGIEDSKRRPKGIDIVIAIDVSGSMNAVDVPAKYQSKEAMQRLLNALASESNVIRQRALSEIEETFQFNDLRSRLGVAKKEIATFIERRPNDRIGLLVFASDAFTVSPPTLDHDFLMGRLGQVKEKMLGDTSTRIAPPILSAMSRLRDADSERRVMLLLTDGANKRPLYMRGEDGTPIKGFDGKPIEITPVGAAERAKEFRIVVHTIGIGSPYAFIVNTAMNGRGIPDPMPNQYDPDLLKEIATKTGGLNFSAEDEDGMTEVMTEIDQLEATPRDQAQYTDYRELFPYLVFIGLAFIVTGFVLDQTVLLKTP